MVTVFTTLHVYLSCAPDTMMSTRYTTRATILTHPTLTSLPTYPIFWLHYMCVPLTHSLCNMCRTMALLLSISTTAQHTVIAVNFAAGKFSQYSGVNRDLMH